MEKIIFIKYGELTTKKGNRNYFITTLYRNIQEKLNGYDVAIEKQRDRMYINPKNENINDILEILKNIFGIFSIVVSYKIPTDFETIKNTCLELMQERTFQTFKIETKRSWKQFTIPSMEVSRQVGAHILKNIDNRKVNVRHPDILFKIEIRKEFTYLYTDEIRGLGGYPVGIQGKGLLMLSGGIDSPVAGFMTLKRGVKLECLYFESPPHTSLEAKNKVKTLVETLSKYGPSIKLHVVPFTKIQEAIYKNIDDTHMITIMRRMMYRIGESYAQKRHCLILVNGESIGQVASQTLDSMSVINQVTNMPVIRPVACMDKLEIIALAKKIKTYETSILPYEDCCTIFLPKHPVIHPTLEKCLEFEQNFDWQSLVEETIDQIETIEISSTQNEKNDLL